VGEVFDHPPVARLNQVDEDSIEEKGHDQDAGAVVPATLHYGVHCPSTTLCGNN
jgi:hypothetical protein